MIPEFPKTANCLFDETHQKMEEKIESVEDRFENEKGEIVHCLATAIFEQITRDLTVFGYLSRTNSDSYKYIQEYCINPNEMKKMLPNVIPPRTLIAKWLDSSGPNLTNARHDIYYPKKKLKLRRFFFARLGIETAIELQRMFEELKSNGREKFPTHELVNYDAWVQTNSEFKQKIAELYSSNTIHNLKPVCKIYGNQKYPREEIVNELHITLLFKKILSEEELALELKAKEEKKERAQKAKEKPVINKKKPPLKKRISQSIRSTFGSS